MTHPRFPDAVLKRAVEDAVGEDVLARPMRVVVAAARRAAAPGDDERRLYRQSWHGLRLQDSPARRDRLDEWFDDILSERNKLLNDEGHNNIGSAP